MNLAFDRDLIGPAMYFGRMGDGQPIGRYDDVGWLVHQGILTFELTQAVLIYVKEAHAHLIFV
ncbi:hypothetical protein Bca52824_036892 [Brassica carinata]|uniref:Uncharacterized protein n=1 Tax=Brassica carinata TaxID=52824 RepID=A0A8X7V1Y4_BRACI|nr:hypothetical protein Bca52824_036892 [Brassica carinata]